MSFANEGIALHFVFLLVRQRRIAMLGLILLILLIMLLVGSVPAWPYSQGWGYYPSGGLGLVLAILIILILLGHVPIG